MNKDKCIIMLKCIVTFFTIVFLYYTLSWLKHILLQVEVPFTNLSTGNHKVGISINTENLKVLLRVNDLSTINFHENLPVKVIEYDDDNLIVFTRPLFRKGFDIFSIDLSNNNLVSKINLPRFLRVKGYFREAFYKDKEVYFVNYHPKKFNDSKGGDKNGDVNKLYRIKLVNNNFIFDKNFFLNLYKDQDIRCGIDRKIHMSSLKQNELIICSDSFCTSLDTVTGILKKVSMPYGSSIIEVSSNDKSIYSILANEIKANSKYIIFDIINRKIVEKVNGQIPFNLKVKEDGEYSYDVLNDQNIEQFLTHKILNSKDSGLLELGMSNDEARIAWSAVYYLNSFIDITSPRFSKEFEFLTNGFKKKIFSRLNIEIKIIDHLLKNGVKGISSTRYSTKQQQRVYAVQSGRILRLLKRYNTHFLPLNNFKKFKKQVESLKDHEEIFYSSESNDIDGLSKGRISLRWPKGINFPFDGFKIPFNHQDDWASGVTYGGDLSRSKESKDIILTLLEKSGIREATLGFYEWKYWYGRVVEPWNEGDNLSTNTAKHDGDKTLADISYRTIDVMALLTVAKIYPELLSEELLHKIILATQKGLLFPFVQEDLIELYGINLRLDSTAISKYLICDSAWCLSNMIWALKDIGT